MPTSSSHLRSDRDSAYFSTSCSKKGLYIVLFCDIMLTQVQIAASWSVSPLHGEALTAQAKSGTLPVASVRCKQKCVVWMNIKIITPLYTVCFMKVQNHATLQRNNVILKVMKVIIGNSGIPKPEKCYGIWHYGPLRLCG
jgi:hypothetical protein